MSLIYRHRLVQALSSAEEISVSGGFSFFDYMESCGLSGNRTVHRCFSIARASGVERMVVERLDPAGVGMVRDEYAWLKSRFPAYCCPLFVRMSFWRGGDPLGVMLVRTDDPRDGVHTAKTYVYEAVMPKYAHRHNCVHGETCHAYSIMGEERAFRGVLFAQQNGFSKCCAHVALYSLLEGNPDVDEEVSFVKMNELAFGEDAMNVDIGETGLLPVAIEKILDYYGVNHHSASYEGCDGQRRSRLDYAAHVYAGTESGYGALLGFGYKDSARVSGEMVGHIVPVYGHTFNKDTWAPDAARCYFDQKGTFGYMPSRMWMSSFIAHDDNVGANLCIPRGFVRQEDVQYVVELLPRDAASSAVEIEAQALQILTAIMGTDSIADLLGSVKWFDRLRDAVDGGDVILRTFPVKMSAYRDYLRKSDGAFDDGILGLLDSDSMYWLVEASVPQLFPANEEKVADMLFSLDKPLDVDGRTNFAFARLPGAWLYPAQSGEDFGYSPSDVVRPLPNFVS